MRQNSKTTLSRTIRVTYQQQKRIWYGCIVTQTTTYNKKVKRKNTISRQF